MSWWCFARVLSCFCNKIAHSIVASNYEVFEVDCRCGIKSFELQCVVLYSARIGYRSIHMILMDIYMDIYFRYRSISLRSRDSLSAKAPSPETRPTHSRTFRRLPRLRQTLLSRDWNIARFYSLLKSAPKDLISLKSVSLVRWIFPAQISVAANVSQLPKSSQHLTFFTLCCASAQSPHTLSTLSIPVL